MKTVNLTEAGVMLSAKQTAFLLGISDRLVYELARRMGLRCYRIRRRVLFDESDVLEFKASCQLLGARTISAGVISITASSTDSNIELLNCFRKAGANPARISTTGSKPAHSTRNQPAKKKSETA